MVFYNIYFTRFFYFTCKYSEKKIQRICTKLGERQPHFPVDESQLATMDAIVPYQTYRCVCNKLITPFVNYNHCVGGYCSVFQSMELNTVVQAKNVNKSKSYTNCVTFRKIQMLTVG